MAQVYPTCSFLTRPLGFLPFLSWSRPAGRPGRLSQSAKASFPRSRLDGRLKRPPMPSTGPAQSRPSGTASRSTSDDPPDHEDHDEAEHDEDIVFRRWAGIVFVAPGFSTRYETCPGASDPVPMTTPSTALASRSRRANIRANKPVPERRMQLHAVEDDPLDSSLDEPERDDAGRSDTGCDGIELPGSQEVRGFESLRLHTEVFTFRLYLFSHLGVTVPRGRPWGRSLSKCSSTRAVPSAQR